jgi:hypothetical protein
MSYRLGWLTAGVGLWRLTFELRGSPTAWRAGQQVQNGPQGPALDGQCDMPLGLPLERRVRPHVRSKDTESPVGCSSYDTMNQLIARD